MAYHFDKSDDSLVIDGWEKGIADNPFNGIADMRNANIISVPGEASVNFKTSSVTPPASSGTMTTSSASGDTVSLSNNFLETGQVIYFSSLSDATKGIALNTFYWIEIVAGGVYKLRSNYSGSSLVDITADSLTGNWATVNMGRPKHFAYASLNVPAYWMVDHLGQVWSNSRVTLSSGYWTFTGNKVNTYSHGNGLVYYAASDGTNYIFLFSDRAIDYTRADSSAQVSWNYQWDPSAGTIGVWNNVPSPVLKAVGNVSHEAFVAPTNQVIYCDTNWVGRFYEKNPATAFVPTTLATYVFDQTNLLPTTDTAQCLTYLGTNILVGGSFNVIYPWNGFSTTFNYPLLLPEYNVTKMVTVNTNTYIFIGNRGRVYITNGTNVQLYKKVPDHISGTIEPYFSWGGATTLKNQIYFSCLVTTNGGSTISQYGGLWAVDTDSNALRLTNKLSYGTYAGYASAMIANLGSNPAGAGLYIGWDNGSSGYGVDTTSSNPYTGSETTIDSDLIPIGTFQQPKEFTKIEYKLTRPLVSGESIVIKTRLVFDTQNTGYTTALTDSTVGSYSGIGDVNFKNAQWVQFQIVLNSTNSSPSYVRLKEIRILTI